MKLSTAQLIGELEQLATQHGVNPEVARAMLLSENSGRDRGGNIVTRAAIDTETTSPKGALGIMQVMPATFQGLIRTGYLPANADPNDKNTQLLAGVMTIKEMQDRGVKNPAEQAVYYNGGGAALADFRAGRPLNAETADYLKKFTNHRGGTTPMATTTSQRVSQQTTEQSYPPGVRERLQAAFGEAQGASAMFESQLQGLLKEITTTADASEKAATKSAEAKAAQAGIAGDIAIATDSNANRILDVFGINLNSPESRLQKHAQTVQRAQDQREALLQQINTVKQEGAGGILDPIGWIMSAVKQQPLIARYNSLAREENMAQTAMDDAHRQATNQRNLQPAAVGDALTKKKLADVDAALAAGEEEKLKIRGAARASIASTLVQLYHTGQQKLANEFKLADLTRSSTTTVVSETEKDDPKTAREKVTLERVNKLLAGFGMEGFADTATFNYLDKDQKEQLILAGQAMNLGSPGNAAMILSRTFKGAGLQQMRQNQPVAAELLTQIVAAGQSEAEVMAAKSKDPSNKDKVKNPFAFAKTPEEITSIGIDAWHARMKKDKDAGNMAALTGENPYKLKPGFAAAQEGMAANPVAEMIRKEPKTTWDDQLIFQKTAAKIATSANPSQEIKVQAAALHRFYRDGFRAQQAKSMMLGMGFENIDSYPMALKINTVGTRTLDAFSAESLEQFLTQQVTRGFMDNLGEGFGAVANVLGGMAGRTPQGQAAQAVAVGGKK